MPDRVSPQQFSAQIKAKYPEYKDMSDMDLATKMVEKFPQYKDYVDFGTQVTPAQTVQPEAPKYQKAVQDDRSEIGKTLSSLWNSVVGGVRDLTKSAFDLAAQNPVMPSNFGAPPTEETVKAVNAFRKLPIEQRVAIANKAFAPVERNIERIRSSYTTKDEEKAMQSKFDVTNGIGLDDMQGLLAMSGRIVTDMAMGAATGGTTFVLQGYQSAVEDYDEAVKKAGLPMNENARGVYGMAGGIINGILEKFAIDKMFGDTPAFRSIQRKVIADALKNVGNRTGKAAIDGIEEYAQNTIKKLTSDIKSKGIRAAYRASIEGGTEGLQASLEDAAKFAANAVQGDQAFNEKEIKENFLKNVVNSTVAGGIFGPILGAGADVTFGRNINKELLNDIANASTDEDFQNINNELTRTFDDNNFSQEERDIVMNNAKRYADIKQSIPTGTPASVQRAAIPLIDERRRVDEQITKLKDSMQNLDESVKASQEEDMRMLEDRRSSINDEVRSLITGDTFNFIEENGKYYKQVNNGPREEISRNRYDLEQIKKEQYATTEGQEPIQEGRAEGDISQRQRTQEEGAQGAPTETDTGYRYIVSEEGDEVPIAALVNKKVKVNGESAILYREGQRIVARVLGTNRVLDTFGSVQEMSNALPSDYGIEVDESLVTETPTGYRVEGAELTNPNENPTDAISYDKNGNVMNVVLTTPAGKRRKFRGEAAKDLAYQITLKEILKNEQEFEQFLEQEYQQELENARLQAAAQEQAAPAIEPVPAETKITVEPAIARVTQDNINDVEKIPGNPIQKKVLMDIRPVINAIGDIVRKITGSPIAINIHNQDTFAQAVLQAGGSQEESTARGFYMASDGSIHLNMDNIDSDTMLHEGFHPILDALQKFNPQVINELFEELSRIPEAAQIIADARANYEGEVNQKKEAITDFVAGVADGRIQLNPSNFQKIKAFILDMLAKIGLGSGSPQLMKVNNEADLIKLANFITERFRTGEEITLQNLEDTVDVRERLQPLIFENLEDVLVGVEQYDSSTGFDINETVPQEGTGSKPQFSKETLEAAKNNAKSIKDFINTQISRVVFYDITRVGKLSIKNIKTGYTPDVDGKGGPFYSYMDNSIKNKSVLAFVSINQAIQSLQRQILYPNGVHAIAAQNPLTAHLGNKSTLTALFGEGVGIFQNAAKTKAQEKEIVGVLVSELDRMSKMPANTEASKSVNKILEKVKLSEIKTINDFRDKILLGEGDSFGKRGSIITELLQNKQSKVTAATRDSHKILHYKYGIPTIADIAQGNNQTELSNVELGDVVKLVKPSTEPVIYTTDKQAFDRYSKNPTPEMKKGGIRIELIPETDAHESYPFILAGENVALLNEYIGAQKLYDRFKGIKKSQTFFKIGRMKKYAEAGIVSPEVTTEEKGPAFQKAKPTAKEKAGIPETRAKQFLKDQFRFGLLGKEMIRLGEKRAGELSAELTNAERLSKKAQELTARYGTSVSKSDIEKYLTGENLDEPLPLDLAETLSEMRSQIDNLTERLIQLGVVDSEESIEYYRQNKGKYLLRSYEAINYQDDFMNKLGKSGLNVDNVSKKLKNVDKTVVDAALNFLANRAMAQNPSLTQEEAMKQARVEANEILSDSESFVMNKGLTGSTNVRSLTQRKDISPEIRALMGEYTDPIYNYYASIFKIASLTSSRQYLNSLKEYGTGKFLFEGKDRPEEASVRIAAEGSATLEPLNGLYTFPEVKEALQKSDNERANIISQAAGRIRKFKTVYNPATHVKNLIGNMGFSISNGHWNYLPESFKYIKANISGTQNKELLRTLDVLNRYGVLNNAVGINELKSYFDRNNSVDEVLDKIYDNGRKKSTVTKAADAIGSVGKAMENAYKIEDDIFKILAFVNESNRYAKALYNTDYTSLTEQQKKDIDQKVSEIVKDTFPTFSRVPKFVKSLSKVAFMGNFLSFPAESIRVQYNSLKLAMNEIKSGNSRLKAVGTSRILGALTYNGILSSMVYYGYNLAGAGLTGMLGYLGEDDDDEKRRQSSINKNVVPWSKAKDIFVSLFEKGKLVYYDIGSLDSYSYQKTVWNTFWANMNNEKGFVESISKAIAKGLDPWMELDFVAKNMVSLLNNDDGRGKQIWNPEATAIERKKQQMLFIGKQFSPGILGASLRLADAYGAGDTDKLMDEATSMFFARKYTVDLKKQFQNYIYVEGTPTTEVGFKFRLQNAQRIYTDAKRQGVRGDALEQKYRQAIDQYKFILMTAKEYYDAAIDGGVNPKDLRDILKKSRIGSAELRAISQGSLSTNDRAYIKK